MNIKTKLIVGFIIVSLFVGIVGILGLYANNKVVASYEEEEESFGTVIQASNEMSSYAKRAQGHTYLYLILHNQSDKKRVHERIASLRENLAILNGKIKNPESLIILNNMTSKTNELESTTESLIKIHDDEMEISGYFDFNKHEKMIRTLDVVSSKLRSDGLELCKMELRLQGERNEHAKKEASFLYRMIFMISGMAVFGALVIGIVISRNVSFRLDKLKDAANKIGKGDLDIKICMVSDDEIGGLANEFNKMAKELQISQNELISSDNKVRKSLEEKEVLLREIHHRVKNNMQIISSLLTHQSEQYKDKKITDIFTESQNRIMSMALVHEKLYQSIDLRNIDLKDYIEDLAAIIFQSYDIHKGNIKLNMLIEDISLDIDHAIPCGLIINELVTNSLKYAFPDGIKGEISISFTTTNENMHELRISDNGIGFPKDLDFRKTKSLGLHLVTILSENQLHGKIGLNQDRGTEFYIQFKKKENNKCLLIS